MKRLAEIALVSLLLGMLVAIDYFFGRAVSLFAAILAAVWFAIAIVLLTRPPGIPEFVSEEVGSDEQHAFALRFEMMREFSSRSSFT